MSKRNMNFYVYHDMGRILCMVGQGFTNTTLHRYFSGARPTELIRFEELQEDKDWFAQRQFLVSSSDLSFKKRASEYIKSKGGEFFSVIAQDNHIGHDVKIGKGCVIKDFNVLLDGCEIGDHTTITHHVTLSHASSVGSFCHIGPYTYAVYSDIGDCVYAAIRTSFLGRPDSIVCVEAGCNFIVGSRVTKPVTKPGTYLDNRCINALSSLEYKIH